MISSPILLLFLLSSCQYTIYNRSNQAMMSMIVLSLTTQSMREKRKRIKELGTKELGTKERNGRMKRLGASTNL